MSLPVFLLVCVVCHTVTARNIPSVPPPYAEPAYLKAPSNQSSGGDVDKMAFATPKSQEGLLFIYLLKAYTIVIVILIAASIAQDHLRDFH